MGRKCRGRPERPGPPGAITHAYRGGGAAAAAAAATRRRPTDREGTECRRARFCCCPPRLQHDTRQSRTHLVLCTVQYVHTVNTRGGESPSPSPLPSRFRSSPLWTPLGRHLSRGFKGVQFLASRAGGGKAIYLPYHPRLR